MKDKKLVYFCSDLPCKLIGCTCLYIKMKECQQPLNMHYLKYVEEMHKRPIVKRWLDTESNNSMDDHNNVGNIFILKIVVIS